MMRQWWLVLWCALAWVQPGYLSAEEVLLLPYFDSNGENGVYLAWSADGRTFQHVHGGAPVFTPPAWPGQNLTRDPSIAFHDGEFHLVWTSNWSGNLFGHASSSDLVNWSAPQQIQPFPTGSEQPNNVWAPEIFYDHVAADFKIVWSSTLNSELEDGDGSEDPHGNDHRMYYVSTSDFESFTDPELLFQDEGYSVIDAHVVHDSGTGRGSGDDRWVMTLKNEQGVGDGGKNIRLAFSDLEISPSSFGQTTDPIAGPGTDVRPGELAEGPSLVRWNDEWLLYWDAYTSGHYSLATSADLNEWTDQTDSLSFPVAHPRHGTVFIADTQHIGWDLTHPLDLDANGEVDETDWQIFVANHLTDLSVYSPAEQARRGDLDGDGDSDFYDYREFQQQYDALFGSGAFEQLTAASVPEPASLVMLLALATTLWIGRLAAC